MICCLKHKQTVGIKKGRETIRSFPENYLAIPLLNETTFNPVGDRFCICIKISTPQKTIKVDVTRLSSSTLNPGTHTQKKRLQGERKSPEEGHPEDEFLCSLF